MAMPIAPYRFSPFPGLRSDPKGLWEWNQASLR